MKDSHRLPQRPRAGNLAAVEKAELLWNELMDEKIIGDNIRQWRLRRGVTLTKTAELAGLTKSTLSKIENGQISPPISTVMRIGDALSVPLADFFSEPKNAPNYALTRKGKGSVITRDGSEFGYSYESLALQMPNKKGEPFVLTIKPGDPSGDFQHGGDEFIYMLAGKLEFTLDGEIMVLNTGDSIYFDPSKPHTARALGKRDARFVCVFIQDEVKDEERPNPA